MTQCKNVKAFSWSSFSNVNLCRFFIINRFFWIWGDWSDKIRLFKCVKLDWEIVKSIFHNSDIFYAERLIGRLIDIKLSLVISVNYWWCCCATSIAKNSQLVLLLWQMPAEDAPREGRYKKVHGLEFSTMLGWWGVGSKLCQGAWTPASIYLQV